MANAKAMERGFSGAGTAPAMVRWLPLMVLCIGIFTTLPAGLITVAAVGACSPPADFVITTVASSAPEAGLSLILGSWVLIGIEDAAQTRRTRRRLHHRRSLAIKKTAMGFLQTKADLRGLRRA